MTTSERISNIPYRMLVKKTSSLEYFDLNVNRDGIKEEKAAELFSSSTRKNEHTDTWSFFILAAFTQRYAEPGRVPWTYSKVGLNCQT